MRSPPAAQAALASLCPPYAAPGSPARRQRRPASAGLPPAPGDTGRAGAANRCRQRLLSGLPGKWAGARAAARGRWSG